MLMPQGMSYIPSHFPCHIYLFHAGFRLVSFILFCGEWVYNAASFPVSDDVAITVPSRSSTPSLPMPQAKLIHVHRLPRRYLTDKSRETIVGTTGSTPLHFAAANGNTSIVSTLLQYGAQPDKADKHGVTPEMLARSNGWLECADLLAVAVRQSRRDGGGAAFPVASGVSEETVPATGRRRLQVKRSIDNALGKIKSSTTNLNEMYHQSKPSLTAQSSSSTTNPKESVTPFSSMGDYHFGRPDETPEFPSHASRRPSLPQISVVPQRLRKTSSSRPGSRPSLSKRPSSAGNGAEPPSPSLVQSTRAQYTVPRKPAPKLSFLNLFKKAHGDDGSSSAHGTGEQSNASTSSFSSVNWDPAPAPSGSGSRSPVSPMALSSSYNEPTHMPARLPNRFRQGSEGSTSLARAVDLHNALAQRHHHTNSETVDLEDEEYRPSARSPRSPGRDRSGSDNSEMRCSWRFGSSFDARDHSLSRPPGDSRSKPGILHKRAHSRSTSTGVAPTSVRFDSNSSGGSARGVPAGRLRESNSVGNFGNPSYDSGITSSQISESISPHVKDTTRPRHGGEDEEEEEEEYGHAISRYSPDPQSLHSVQHPNAANHDIQAEGSFPFDINQPPPDDTELSASRPSFDRSTLSTVTGAAPRPNSRDRGDSLSSAASSNVPELLRSNSSSISSETPPIRSPPSQAKVGLGLAPVPSSDSSPGVGARRQHTPVDIDIQEISSHAQAEAMVNQARQRILDDDGVSILQGAEGAGSGDNVPLSAKLAAFGKTLAVERMFKEERDRQAASSASEAEGGDMMTPISRDAPFGQEQRSDNPGRRPSLTGKPRRRSRRPNTSEGPTTQGQSPSSISYTCFELTPPHSGTNESGSRPTPCSCFPTDGIS